MLSAHDLSVTYSNNYRALNPTNVRFTRGQFVVLLGASGAGKSTLLRCLNGLVKPTQGDVRTQAHGSIFTSNASLRAHRRRTGMVFQQHHLIGRMSALRNVLMGRLAFHGSLRSLAPLARADRQLGLEALERVGLLDRALQRADRLSGGQQQRVGIARALVQEPEIILADEPVASLDPATALRVLSDLHRICREDGITAIVSLHQVDLARQFADHIIGISAGSIVFEGTPDKLDTSDLQKIYEPQHLKLAQAAE
jgi:phosphonate transport system ATP-binding protein